MIPTSIKEAELQIAKLKKEIADLEKVKNVFSALSPAQQLATLIHKKQCHLAHEDMCGWYYDQTWDKEYSSKKEYLNKANNLLMVLNDDLNLAMKVVEVL